MVEEKNVSVVGGVFETPIEIAPSVVQIFKILPAGAE